MSSKGNAAKRTATKYPGVFVREDKTGDQTYYIRYRQGRGRKAHEVTEVVGRKSEGMTLARANIVRATKIEAALSPKNKNMQEEQAPVPVNTEPWTLEKLWQAYCEAVPGAKGTRATDRSNYRNYLSKDFGNKTVEEVTTYDIDRLRNKLLKAGKKPATVRAILELMRRLFNFGSKYGWLVIPNTLRFNMPKVDNLKTEIMTDSQLKAYLQALDEYEYPHIAACLKFVFNTGIRRSAAIALQWEDYDAERHFITLRGESAKSGKTKAIPVSQTVQQILASLPHNKGAYIFPQLGVDAYTDHARKIRDRAGLPKDFRPIHGLRHNFASCLASSGKVSLYTVQSLLTHASPQMTQRYAHLNNEALKSAAQVADDVLNGK